MRRFCACYCHQQADMFTVTPRAGCTTSLSPSLSRLRCVLLYGSFRRRKNEIAVKPSRRDANRLELRLYEVEFFARPTRDPTGTRPRCSPMCALGDQFLW